jgi:acetoin utilization protein AcuB
MKVRELMQESVYTVKPEDLIDRVYFLLRYEKIRHLPVLEKKTVVGIVSDRDLYKALGPKSRSKAIQEEEGESSLQVIPRKVRSIMRQGVITIEPDQEAATAATMMAEKKIGALPVIQDGKLVGIITRTDILVAFADLQG